MSPLKVLIVGGGIAGHSLAYWLSRINAEITIIERFPHLRATGQQVDIRSYGVSMMKKMGIEAASLTSEFEIRRGDLVRILYELTRGKENVKHVFGTAIQDFTQDDESDLNGKVHVTFEDGEEEDFDLVIGADGAGSKIRQIMLGPDATDPRYSLGGHIRFFTIPGKPDESNSLAELKKAWVDIYQDGGWECERFMRELETAPEADDLYATSLDEIRLPKGSWSKGRVVLLGDSAYCQTVGGLGATLSRVGAYVLAGEIAKLYRKETLSTAVVQGGKNYEKMRPLTTSAQSDSMSGLSMLLPSSSLAIKVLHTIAGVAALFKRDQLSSISTRASTWELPTYPELERE